MPQTDLPTFSVPRYPALLMAQETTPPAARHGANALVALLLLLGAGFVASRATSHPERFESAVATIAVEHAKPASVDITLGYRANGTLIDLRVRAEEAVLLSVPDTWQLRETRGVPLASITQMDPADGFRKIRMPTGTASFIAPQAVGRLTVHNPTAQPLRARVVSLNLTMGEQDEDEAIVVKDPVTLPFSDSPSDLPE